MENKFVSKMQHLYGKIEEALDEAGDELLEVISKSEQMQIVKDRVMGVPMRHCNYSYAGEELAKIVAKHIGEIKGKNK